MRTGHECEPTTDLFVIILREVWDTEGVVEQWARYAKQKFEAALTDSKLFYVPRN